MGGDVDEPPSRTPAEVRAAWGIAADAPLALYTGTFEAYQGVDMLIDAAAIVARPAAATRESWWWAASPRRWRPRGRRPRAAGAGGGDGVHRAAARARDSRLRAGGGCPGVAAHSRHQHAAEDLLVPAIGPAHRRHQPAHAHAGADARRSRGSPRRSRRPLPRRCSTCWHTPASARGWRRRRRRVAEAKYSREAYLRRTARGLRAARRHARRSAPADRSIAGSWRACDGAGDRGHRFHGWPPGGHAGRARRRGAGAGAAGEPRALRRVAAAGAGCAAPSRAT